MLWVAAAVTVHGADSRVVNVNVTDFAGLRRACLEDDIDVTVLAPNITFPSTIELRGRRLNLVSSVSTVLEGAGSVTLFNASGSVASLHGFVFANGVGTSGGAIEASNGTRLTITDSTFHSNTAVSGGAISITGAGSKLTVLGCIFRSNEASTYGGALMIDEIKTFVSHNSTFVGNSGSMIGGALCLINTDSTLENTVLNGNSASGGRGPTAGNTLTLTPRYRFQLHLQA